MNKLVANYRCTLFATDRNLYIIIIIHVETKNILIANFVCLSVYLHAHPSAIASYIWFKPDIDKSFYELT